MELPGWARPEVTAATERERDSRSLWWALLPPAALGFILLTLFTTDSWLVIRVPNIEPQFADLVQVTATADCVRNGSWTMESYTCDPLGRPFNYPKIWAHGFALLHLGLSSTDYVGYGLAVTLVGSVLLLTISMRQQIGRPLFALMMTAVVVSPPFLLVAERGNIDIAVFLAVVVGAIRVASKRRWSGTVILSLAVIAKLYPVGALGSLLVGRSTRGPKYGPLLVAILVTAVWFAATASELPLILERTPQYAHLSYGAGVLPAVLRRVSGVGDRQVTLLDRLVGLILLACAVVGMAWLETRGRNLRRALSTAWATDLATNRIGTSCVLAGGGVLVLSYAVSVNFDYRLVFVSIIVSGLLTARQTPHHGLLSPIRLAGALTAVLWLTFPMPGHSEYLGDLALALIVPYLVLVLGRLAMASLGQGRRDPNDLAVCS